MTQRKRRGKREVLAAGKHLRLVNDNGWEYAERVNASGIVAIVALTRENDLILIEQYRPAIRKRVIEIPAGLAGDIPGEESEAFTKAARRELLEETGYRAHKLEPLFRGPPSAGMSTEMIDFYLARNVRRVGEGGGDHHEDIQVHVVPLEEAATWLRKKDTARRCIDPKVYTGLLFAIAAVSEAT
jgi:ADP-ribose pyrophosphatase